MKKVIVPDPPRDIPSLHYHPLLHRIYANRGISSPNELTYDLGHLLPFTDIKNINAAVALLTQALNENWQTIVVGDFDTDGATSTALTMEALKSFGLRNISYIIPNRFTYGYGLTKEITEVIIAENKPQLIITVDNGISSVEAVALANQHGIPVLITDHHLPGNKLPQAAIIVNPNQIGDNFLSKSLAGVGVAFYLMLALRAHLRSINWFDTQKIPEPSMAQFLDLVAIGTIADAVALDRNNRILVANGIGRIRMGKCRLGILSILTHAKRDHKKLTTHDIGFIITPRINAAGRLDSMSLGVETLLTNDPSKAKKLAQQLNALNDERRTIEKDMQNQALRELENLELTQHLPAGYCIFEESWHQGVLGILAARLKDKLKRPVITFTIANELEIKGSARSIEGIHMLNILTTMANNHPQLISNFGGHAMAAGLSLPRDNYKLFAQIFAQEVERCLATTELTDIFHSDGELTMAELNLSMAELLHSAGPWGNGFLEPLFHGSFMIAKHNLLGQKHLKLVLHTLDSKQNVDGIYFNVDATNWLSSQYSKIDILYKLGINEYGGHRKLQLVIQEIINGEP